jgi:apolipoprotein N-acyltransferase
MLWVMKKIFLCLLSAALLILSFPNFNLWILAWFGFLPFFFALQNISKIKAFLLSYFTGLAFWFGIIYWLIHVTLPGMVVLAGYLAFYFAIFGLLLKIFLAREGKWGTLFIPCLWCVLEYCRSHLFTGFPWALLGYSQFLNLAMIQIADSTGAWGVSFLVMMSNVFIYSLINKIWVPGTKHRVAKINIENIVVLGLFIAVLVYGIFKLSFQAPASGSSQVRISVVQGNIPQYLKWEPRARGFILRKYFSLSESAFNAHPDLIIWPEAALPVVLEEEPEYYHKVLDFAAREGRPLLFGAVSSREGNYYNSALLISGKGRLLQRYDKLHLVPFGEYIPLRKTFRFLESIVPIGDFTAGRQYTLFNLARLKFAVLICFEDLFPELSRRFSRSGADFLVNITNDAWFGETSSPYQHLAASVFRAVEARRYLIRAANTGISGFIAPTGKIISLVGRKNAKAIFTPGYKTQTLSIAKAKPSFYANYGDWFILANLIYLIVSLRFLLRNKRDAAHV